MSYLLLTKTMMNTTSTRNSTTTGTTTPTITAVDVDEPQEPVQTLECACQIISLYVSIVSV